MRSTRLIWNADRRIDTVLYVTRYKEMFGLEMCWLNNYNIPIGHFMHC